MGGKKVEVLDTTLRDGAQGEGVSFSVSDKLDVAKRLDEIGFDYIEGGWPGSNRTDDDFFEAMKEVKLGRAKLAAFGSTRHAKRSAGDDPVLRSLVGAGTEVVTIFGKAWDLHVRDVLRVGRDENLRMIEESVAFLARGAPGDRREIIFEAEHFFDGWKADAEYALECLRAAIAGGSRKIVLCETNGGCLPREVAEGVEAARDAVGPLDVDKDDKGDEGGIVLGIHTHNDGGLAVANALAAVEAGCRHVQGTVNGIGERCGNADLCVLVPTLRLKLGYEALPPGSLARLVELSRYVNEMALLLPRDNQPYVGRSAFTHKGGMHVHAVERNPATYEHVRPDLVGNRRRVLMSELSGRSAVRAKMVGLALVTPDDEDTMKILERVQDLEHLGYEFEAAEASFEMLSRKALGTHRPFFELEGFRVISELDEKGFERTEATIKVTVGENEEHTAAEGNGPVNALDGAFRKALVPFYPGLRDVQLTNYKVRIVDPQASTAAKVLVLIESRDSKDRWTTVGVSENIIEASWIALVDSVEYKLTKDGTEPPGKGEG